MYLQAMLDLFGVWRVELFLPQNITGSLLNPIFGLLWKFFYRSAIVSN